MTNELLTSFFVGLLATTSPCVFPLYPGFLAYLSGSRDQLKEKKGHYVLGFFVLAGVLTMMLILGAIIALLSISVGRALTYIIPVTDLLIISLGILLLFDINFFKRLPQIQIPVLSHPFANAYLYGLLYGPIALPCSGPLVVSIFALSFTVEEAASKLIIFLMFGLGFGMPLLLLSFLAGATQRKITRLFAMHSRLVNIVSGVLLIGVGIYDLWQNWGLIQVSLPFL